MRTVHPRERSGFTLLELLVVGAILAVLVGLLLPAVQKVRGAALRIQSASQIRQIALAMHGYAESRGGALPRADGVAASGAGYEWSHHVMLLPYLEQSAMYDHYQAQALKLVGNTWNLNSSTRLRIFEDPTDRSLNKLDRDAPYAVCSYALNALVFVPHARIDAIADGTSHTLAYATKYAWNCRGVRFSWTSSNLANPGFSIAAPTFADEVFGHAVPRPGVGVPAVTFQVAPTEEECDPTLPQTALPGGMVVALMDGGVRRLAPGVAPPAYWAAVTPAGGEVGAPDW